MKNYLSGVDSLYRPLLLKNKSDSKNGIQKSLLWVQSFRHKRRVSHRDLRSTKKENSRKNNGRRMNNISSNNF